MRYSPPSLVAARSLAALLWVAAALAGLWLLERSRLGVAFRMIGGDETLAGYWRYLPLRLRDLLSAGDVPAFLRKGSASGGE